MLAYRPLINLSCRGLKNTWEMLVKGLLKSPR